MTPGASARPIYVLATLLVGASILWPSQDDIGRPGAKAIVLGWADELSRTREWSHLGIGNKPLVTTPQPGRITLTLRAVPSDWPYEYQWSGITREAKVDIGRFPFVTAYVPQLMGGYAHLDIDVLDAHHKAVKTFRSSTLQAGGVTFFDFTSKLDPATYLLAIRLIVGGSNLGCWCTYNWVRFTSAPDGETLRAHPDWTWFARTQSPAVLTL